jgi:hypothetical protein
MNLKITRKTAIFEPLFLKKAHLLEPNFTVKKITDFIVADIHQFLMVV